MAAKTSKTERTRQSIIDAYVQMMREMPYEKITVTELRRRVGIVRSTFYVYFPSTYDVIDEIERTVLAKTNIALTRSNGPTGDRLHTPRCMVEWLQACYECRDYITTLLGEYGDPYFKGKMVYQLAALDEQVMDADGIPRDKLRSFYLKALTSLQFDVMAYWISDECPPYSVEQIANVCNIFRAGSSVLDVDIMRDDDAATRKA